jgi:hypothetical protein
VGVWLGDGISLGLTVGAFVSVGGIFGSVREGGLGDAEVGALVGVGEAHPVKMISVTVTNVQKSIGFIIIPPRQGSQPSE